MNDLYQETIEQRQVRDKESILEYLRKMPIAQIACERAGIARATYYRWRNEDKEFKKAADEAMRDGEAFINDLSESQVVTLIKDRNLPAITLWLKNHHPAYADRIKVEASISRTDEPLSAEEEKLVRHALACLRGTANEKSND
ncbi:MAG: phBC6A51 family helix-turn-helix protein [Patescibacteria group bacterium]